MLAVEKLILIVIFLIVLILCLYFLFGIGKGTADQLLLQNQLRSCCGKYRAYDCEFSMASSIQCSDDSIETVDSLAYKLNLIQNGNPEQLNKFCACKEV